MCACLLAACFFPLPASSLPAQYSQPTDQPANPLHKLFLFPLRCHPCRPFPLSTPLQQQARTYPCVAHNQNRVDARKGEKKSILPWQFPVQPSIIGCHHQSVSYAFSGNTPILSSVWLYLLITHAQLHLSLSTLSPEPTPPLHHPTPHPSQLPMVIFFLFFSFFSPTHTTTPGSRSHPSLLSGTLKIVGHPFPSLSPATRLGRIEP